jgi:hypothetical protein
MLTRPNEFSSWFAGADSVGVHRHAPRSVRGLRYIGRLSGARPQRSARLANRSRDERPPAARGQKARPLRAMPRARLRPRWQGLARSLRRVSRTRESHSPRRGRRRAALWRRHQVGVHHLSRLYPGRAYRGHHRRRVLACRLRALSRGPPRGYARRRGSRLERLRELSPPAPGCDAQAGSLRGMPHESFDPPRRPREIARTRVHHLPSAPARTCVRGARHLPKLSCLRASARSPNGAVCRWAQPMRGLPPAARLRQERGATLSFVSRRRSGLGRVSCACSQPVHQLPRAARCSRHTRAGLRELPRGGASRSPKARSGWRLHGLPRPTPDEPPAPGNRPKLQRVPPDRSR